MEKRFIIIECTKLGDQWECDADRKITTTLFSEEEIRELANATFWIENDTGNQYSSLEKAQEAYQVRKKQYGKAIGRFRACFTECPANGFFECYEIVGQTLEYREDLSTY